jgi:hypothetical protein
LENDMKHIKLAAWLRRLVAAARTAYARQSQVWIQRMEAPSAR